jgi:hypothetical protein
MTKVDTPSSTRAPKVPAPYADDDLQEWERRRKAWLAYAQEAEDDESQRRVEEADYYEDLIRASPCRTAEAARLKLDVILRDVRQGERSDVVVSVSSLADQVAEYLDSDDATLAPQAAPTGLLYAWRKAHALGEMIDRDPPEDDDSPTVTLLLDLEREILQSPIETADDALAVLFAVGQSPSRRNRADEMDIAAYQRALAWWRASHA